MNRILIVGISGTGKSYLARRLSARLNLPVIFLDAIIWKKHWRPSDEATAAAKIQTAIAGRQWILEGYIEPLGCERVQRAELVLYLDYSGFTALKGGLRRWLQYHGKARPEMPSSNIESLSVKYLWIMLRRLERPGIERAIRGNEGKVVRLTSRKMAERYVRTYFGSM